MAQLMDLVIINFSHKHRYIYICKFSLNNRRFLDKTLAFEIELRKKKFVEKMMNESFLNMNDIDYE